MLILVVLVRQKRGVIMRIAVCDDEQSCRDQLIAAVDRVCRSLDVVTDGFGDGGELLKQLEKTPYDLIFLDIEMPNMDGITLAKRIREKSVDVPMVFLTAHIEYALEGYEVNALRYLTKPVNEQKLREVIEYVKSQMKEQRAVWVRTDMSEERVALKDIRYFEAQNQNVIIYTERQTYTVRYNIGDYERELQNDGFFRIHRGYLVSLGKIKRISKGEVTLIGDTVLPVSRSKEKELREALFAHIKEAAI